MAPEWPYNKGAENGLCRDHREKQACMPYMNVFGRVTESPVVSICSLNGS